MTTWGPDALCGGSPAGHFRGSRLPGAAMWYYRTAVCTFWIRFVPQGGGRFLLGADEEELALYSSPEGAADDVSLRRTGREAWDLSDPDEGPFDLGNWTRIDCRDWMPPKGSPRASGG